MMELKAHRISKRHEILQLILISTMLGLFYPLLAGELNDIRAILNGIFIGFFGGIIVAVFEYKIFNPKYRKLSFITVILLKIILYFSSFMIIILGVKGFIDSLFAGKGFMEYLQSDDFRRFIIHEDFDVILTYTFIILALITFTIQMARKIGYATFLNMISGKYYIPREEKRIFMLLDLKSSTTLAEKFGNLKYHQFLNDFYYDITRCILAVKGEIYRYVGDEVIISWVEKTGIENMNCLRAYIYIQYEMRKQREKYLVKYGIVPEFTTCFHAGRIVAGEIGEVKSQIVFSGETLAELQKLKKAGLEFQKNPIISESLILLIDLPDIYQKEELGLLVMDDQAQNIKIYTFKEAVIK
jgi:adenylate cyclase